MAGGAARQQGKAVVALRGIAGVVLLAAVMALGSAPHARAQDPTIAAAGDIACSASSSNYNGGEGTADRCRQKHTSNLLVNAGLSAVLILGDMQYESASYSGINNSYHPTWGRVKSITRPALGNHEYQTSGAAGYFDYFNGVGVANGPAGERGKGYYSFNIGTWHLIALNSSDHCTIVSCAAGSAQEQWLRADLAANPNYCTLAFWHDPRFNSGHDKNADEMQPLFQALYDGNADVILGGHAHDYERFAPQNPSGQLDNARGIRQFVVGTGGAFWTSISTPQPNSQIRQNHTYGVLKLTLRPTSYDWEFVPEAGKTFTDSGTGQCHGGTAPPPDTTKPSIPGNLRATAGVGQVSLVWNASSDNVGVTGYRVFRGTTLVNTVGGSVTTFTDTNLAPGTYTYTVRAIDAAGNVSDPSNSATATVTDITKPLPPTVTATGSAGQVALSWQGASDNVGITSYRVFRGTTQIATPGGSVTSHTDTGLDAGSYSYTVRAVDAAGNVSDPSNTASATVPDTTKPSPPPGFTATGSAGQVALAWQAATDNVGVTGYRVFRGATQIASLGAAARSHTDSGLAAGPYTYTVRAVDAAGNLSDPSTATGTVPDTTKPTVPAAVAASSTTSAAVNVSWQASQDNVGVTGYRIYRDGTLRTTAGAGATTFSDTTVAATVTYRYIVRAIDAAGNESDPSSEAVVTVPDTVAPAVPGNLRTTSITSNRVDLAWNAATDNVAVTGYRIYREGIALANVPGSATSYSDTSVAAGTYGYTVRAFDAAGNLSDPSNGVQAEVPDVAPPTIPQNLVADPGGPLEVDLTWDASSDNVGVASYLIYRNDVHVDTVTTTSHTDTVLTPGNYTYRVRAVDDAGNLSGPSNADDVIVLVPDFEPPTIPGNLRASRSGDEVTLTWVESTDNVGVTGYRLYRNEASIGYVTSGNSYTDTHVPSRDHEYVLRAQDAQGNLSQPSNPVSIVVPDTEPPAAPTGVSATTPDGGPVRLTWDEGIDNVGIGSYEVHRDGALIATLDPRTAWTDPVGPGTYTYRMKALDPAGNVSPESEPLEVTVLAVDTEKPTAPGNLSAQAGPARIDLAWQASSDNRGVIGYQIRRNGAVVALVGPTTSWSDTAVAAPQTYEYVVRALDAAGNASDPSNTANATVPDTQKPTAPGNLTATGSANRADLTWNASSDDVAVTGYNVYRDGTLRATVGVVTSWSDTSVTAPGHTYQVRAFDAANNLSDPSDQATATVPDTQKPTVPGNLAAGATGPNQVNLTWNASSDNIGVTGYNVYRDGAPIATLGAVTSFSDTGVAGSTTYQYVVRARDAAGNLSDPSNSPSVTTPSATQVLTFVPQADARVHSGTATTNYGTSYLRADGGSNPVESMLRFAVSGTTAGTIRSAKLRMYAYSGTVDGPAVFTTNPAWDETTITWNTRPPRTSEPTDDKGAIPTNSWVEYDVTPFVTANGSYSFGIASTVSDGVDIHSREAATLQPELVVTTGPPDTQKPSAPSGLTGSAASPGQVDLTWNAASDNVGVTGYRVYRNGNQIAALGVTTAYSDTTVSPNSSYSYTVRAVDAAGNQSDPSNSLPVTTPAGQTVLTLQPEADARTHEASPSTNYGTSYLRANGGTESDVESFMRFSVTGVTPGSVQSARLRLYAYNGTADGPALYTTATSWNESTITWSTRPARTSPATGDLGAIPVNSWFEYDVTSFVTGSGTYSFTLATTSNDGVDFHNREAATLRPELVVTVR